METLQPCRNDSGTRESSALTGRMKIGGGAGVRRWAGEGYSLKVRVDRQPVLSFHPFLAEIVVACVVVVMGRF